jgi:uncharacterized membrane protein
LAFAAHYLVTYRCGDWKVPYLRFLHAGSLWLLTAVAAWELSWGIDRLVQGAGTWPLIAWALVPTLMILTITGPGQRLSWPLQRHWGVYLTLGLGPIAVFLWLWLLSVNLASRGDPWPLPYVPVLNPLDVMTGLAFVALLYWGLRVRALNWDLLSPRVPRVLIVALAASVFLWLNAILVRTVHYWGGVPFSASAMFDSVLLQSSLSLFWTLLALLVMVYATKKRTRAVWMVGAGLLAAVVVKLFIIDLAGVGTVERIVSFLGVGILLLIIGYLSPAPPRDVTGREAEGAAS